MSVFTESILKTLELGVKVTLSNGISLHTNLNNDIVYEYRGDKKTIPNSEVDDILNAIKFWKTEKGRYIDMNFMTTGHIENSIKHQEKKLLKPINRIQRGHVERSINDLQTILRERNINDILEDENFGLDNLS